MQYKLMMKYLLLYQLFFLVLRVVFSLLSDFPFPSGSAALLNTLIPIFLVVMLFNKKERRLLSNREIECFTHGMIIPQYTLVILFYRDVEALSWFYERYLLFPANYIIVPIVLYIVSYVMQKLFIRVSIKAVFRLI